MEFAELVMRRRTVRRFTDEPVNRAILENIARLAQHTPSAGFSQGQRLVIVTEPETRRLVGRICEEEPEFGPESFGPWISTCAAQFIPCVSEEVCWQSARQPVQASPIRSTSSSRVRTVRCADPSRSSCRTPHGPRRIQTARMPAARAGRRSLSMRSPT